MGGFAITPRHTLPDLFAKLLASRPAGDGIWVPPAPPPAPIAATTSAAMDAAPAARRIADELRTGEREKP